VFESTNLFLNKKEREREERGERKGGRGREGREKLIRNKSS